MINEVLFIEVRGFGKMIKLLIASLLLIAGSANAAWKDSNGLKVNLISVWASNGGVLVQTSPKHSISGLSCTDNYWAELSKNSEGYEAMLSVLLTAQASNKQVFVRVSDAGSDKFCNLQRVILSAE